MVRTAFLCLIFFASFLPDRSQAQRFNGVDPQNARSVFQYLNDQKIGSLPVLRTLDGDSCAEALRTVREGAFQYFSDSFKAALSCETMNAVWMLYANENYDWHACMPEIGQVGSADHINACLKGFATEWSKARNLQSCQQVYENYDHALSRAFDPMRYFPPQPTSSSRGSISTGPTPFGGLAPSGTATARLDGVEVQRTRERSATRYRVNYGGANCAVAAQVIRDQGGSVEWLACTDYGAIAISDHVTQCLGSDLRRLNDCLAIRNAYEERLLAAYGGTMPRNYQALACSDIGPVLDAKQAEADRLAAARDAPREPSGTAPSRSRSSANDGGAGGFFIILAILAAAGGTAYYFLQNRTEPLPPEPERAYRTHPPTGDEATRIIEQINARFDAGTGKAEARLQTRVFDRVELPAIGDGPPKVEKVEFNITADLSQSIGAMKRPDREVMRVIELLNAMDIASVCKPLDFPRLGMVYGDGKATIDYIEHSKVLRKYLLAKGLSSADAFVKLGMTHLGLNMDVAKSSLVTLIENLKNSRYADNPLVAEATARLRGGAAWAGERDLSSDFDPNAPDGLFLGVHEDGGAEVRYSGEGSIITVASPGSGKTQCNVLPNLLEWDGPAIVLDVKGEIFDKTAAWRAKNGHPIYRFAPMDPDNSHKFNPLDLVRSDPDHLWDDARFLAKMLIVPKAQNDPYWDTRAQDFLGAAIAAVCTEPEDSPNRTLLRVMDFVHGRDIELMFGALELSGVRAMERASSSWQDIKREGEKQFFTFLSSAQTAMSAWESAKVERVISGSDWHPFDLRQEPYPTIYVTLKAGEIDAYSSLLRVFIAQHIRTLVTQLPEHGVKPILFMLDELPRLKYMEPIEEALEVGRQYGIKLWMFAQSIGQLEQSYPNAKGMIGSCAVRTFMNPSMHDGTAERVSKELGQFESPMDGSRHNIADPQDLAGPKYKGLQLVLPSGGKPIKAVKKMAFETEPYRSRMNEKV